MATINPTPWKCEPTDDSCVRPVEPTFKPGIAVKHSPSCSGNICGLFQCDGGNWRVTSAGTLDRSEWIKGWIMTQLLTRGQIECTEHPLGKRDGGWWADAFRTSNSVSRFQSGSKLWALQFASGGSPNQLLVRAKQYAQEALSYLVSWGIVSKLTIDALFVSRSAYGMIIHLRIKVAGPGAASGFTVEGQQLPSSEWLWREYRPAQQPTGTGRYYSKVS
jgi:phage gp46-like protein